MGSQPDLISSFSSFVVIAFGQDLFFQRLPQQNISSAVFSFPTVTVDFFSDFDIEGPLILKSEKK